MQRYSIFMVMIGVFHISNGLYNTAESEDRSYVKEWSAIKHKLGLSNQKADFLKSQKDQEGTVKLICQFLEQNPKYNLNKGESQSPVPNNFLRVYYNIIRRLNLSKGTLKTSVNFELADKSQRGISRHRRKIAVKIISDIPSEKIDDLLKMFNLKHRLHHANQDVDEGNESDDGNNYNDFHMNLPSASDADYVYENLYEDEEDLAAPAKSRHNSEYGSFQDLILQASRHLLHREVEETKLSNHGGSHLI